MFYHVCRLNLLKEVWVGVIDSVMLMLIEADCYSNLQVKTVVGFELAVNIKAVVCVVDAAF